MSHILVETLQSPSGQIERETSDNGPAIETQNARLEQLGVFRRDNIGANDSATAMTLQAVDAVAPPAFVAGRAGKIVGLVVRMLEATTAGAIAAGDVTFRATIGGAAVGTAAAMDEDTDGALKVVNFASPVDFAEADLLGVTVASAGLSPTTSDAQAWLLIRWTAASA